MFWNEAGLRTLDSVFVNTCCPNQPCARVLWAEEGSAKKVLYRWTDRRGWKDCESLSLPGTGLWPAFFYKHDNVHSQNISCKEEVTPPQRNWSNYSGATGVTSAGSTSVTLYIDGPQDGCQDPQYISPLGLSNSFREFRESICNKSTLAKLVYVYVIEGL